MTSVDLKVSWDSFSESVLASCYTRPGNISRKGAFPPSKKVVTEILPNFT
jgi:hypothetical protein